MKNQTDEKVVLRGRAGATNLISAFGTGVKETRLTSFLGYLLSLNIGALNSYLGILPPVVSITIERKLATQRCDIVVETKSSVVIIEAKKGNFDTSNQLKKQISELETNKKPIAVSLTRNSHSYPDQIHSRTWQGVYETLAKAEYKGARQRVLSEELMSHLAESGLVKVSTREVYARDVNKVANLSLYLLGQVYFCKANDNIYKCSYFAPYFGSQISMISPGVKEGMSYVSKIVEHVEVNTFEELSQGISAHIRAKKLGLTKARVSDLLNQIRSDEKYDDNVTHILLLLETPRMLFNPPINKKNLQEGSGWLSKNYYEFDEIFEAAKL